MPSLVLSRPRHHHVTSKGKRQHVAINLQNQLSSNWNSISELDMAKEEDEMIKSNLLPNMKDMELQREQARQEQNSGLKYPLAFTGSNVAPIESASKKFFQDDPQNFWIGKNINKGIEDQHESKFVQQQQQQQINSEATTSNEDVKFRKEGGDIGGRDEDTPLVENERRKDEADASRRDSFQDSEDFNDGFKDEEDVHDNLATDKEMTESKPFRSSHKKEVEESSKRKQVEALEEESSKRYSTDVDSNKDEADQPTASVNDKTDNQISDVLKSVFGQGDSQFPLQKEQYF